MQPLDLMDQAVWHCEGAELVPDDKVGEEAFAAWQADRAAGLDSSMLAPTRDLVSELNQQARAHRLDGIDPALLEPPVNALRLTLHPGGLAPRIENFREWRTHVFHRLNGLIDQTADPGLVTLLEELKSYPVPPGAAPYRPGDMIHPAGIAIPFHLRTEAGTLSFLSTTTVFGTALDIALSECAIETFLPADARTAARLMPGS